MTQTVLITNHQLTDYTGSELSAFELAVTLKQLGYRPLVATFFYGQPLSQLFINAGIEVFSVLDTLKLNTEAIDIIWARHVPVLNVALFENTLKSAHVVYESLSPYEPLEAPPHFINDLSLCLANSEETKETLLSLGVQAENIQVNVNSVTDNFWQHPKTAHSEQLKKLVIISNHVPEELFAATQLLEQAGIEVSIVGMHTEPKLVTPQMLEGFDAIVSIGRSVQYGLSMKIPVYCYDRFGGPGWISPDNVAQALFYNFSGRCCHRQLSPQGLADELIQGYTQAVADTHPLFALAQQRFSLTENVRRVLDRLDGQTPINLTDIRQKYGLIKKQSDYYCRLLRHCRNIEAIMKQQQAEIKALKELPQNFEEALTMIKAQAVEYELALAEAQLHKDLLQETLKKSGKQFKKIVSLSHRKNRFGLYYSAE
jgi:hypothetical protein